MILLRLVSAAENGQPELLEKARKGIEFLVRSQFDDGSFPQRYDIKGDDASNKPEQMDGNEA